MNQLNLFPEDEVKQLRKYISILKREIVALKNIQQLHEKDIIQIINKLSTLSGHESNGKGLLNISNVNPYLHDDLSLIFRTYGLIKKQKGELIILKYFGNINNVNIVTKDDKAYFKLFSPEFRNFISNYIKDVFPDHNFMNRIDSKKREFGYKSKPDGSYLGYLIDISFKSQPILNPFFIREKRTYYILINQ